MEKTVLNGRDLTLRQLCRTVREKIAVEIDPAAAQGIRRSRELVEECVREKKVVYGLTTGFGKFSDVHISEEDAKTLQENLIMSHACGVGEPLPEEVVRAMMLLRVNALSEGYSGIRLSTLETLTAMLNRGVVPVVPSQGSLGASGDLVPLAHMTLVLIGKGEAWYQGRRMPGKEAMGLAGIAPVELTSKEGLALINGTQCMAAIGSLAVCDAINLMRSADVAAALTLEALCGIRDAFDPRVHAIRRQPGQMAAARNILRLTEGSGHITRQGQIRVQDAYSLRCVPQIHGPSRDAIGYTADSTSPWGWIFWGSRRQSSPMFRNAASRGW